MINLKPEHIPTEQEFLDACAKHPTALTFNGDHWAGTTTYTPEAMWIKINEVYEKYGDCCEAGGIGSPKAYRTWFQNILFKFGFIWNSYY